MNKYWYVAGASVQGYAHQLKNQPNQDYIAFKKYAQSYYLSLSDGLGSKPYSHWGAKYACQSALLYWQEQWDLSQLHAYWLTKLGNISAKQAGATLLTACITPNMIKTVQLGDGLILVRSGGEIFIPTNNQHDFLNQTHSLSQIHQPHLWQQVNYPILKQGDGVILMSDGICDDIEPKYYIQFFETIYQQFQKRSTRANKKWLQKEFNEWATPFSHDDKSLVALFKGVKK